jgi:alkaline phosphatase D
VVARLSRRLLLAGAAANVAPAIWTCAAAQGRQAADPFRVGVASGEPLPDGVVLWTRLVTDPRAMGGGMTPGPVAVRWEVAEDPGLTRIVRHGEEIARANAGHAVHVEVSGLKPDREYWYRFNAGGHSSVIARTRTAPEPGADVQSLRIAYGSCQKWEAGYFAAHRHLAADNPDLVLFLGDYIYEKMRSREDGVVRPHPEVEALDLASYRQRYAWYKADPDLQAAHAAAPWIVTWDDHEVANDYGGAADRTPLSRDLFLQRRAAAYQAYWENMPLRRASRPKGPDMPLYRSLDWGRLARLAVLDDRQYRDSRTCRPVEDGKRIPHDCPERLDPKRSILGGAQDRWLEGRLSDTKARWNLLGQQTLMGELRLEEGKVSNDGWDGYPATRQRILETWRDAKVANPVALGGDVHCFFAGDLALERKGAVIGTEFVGGSISSLGRSNKSLAGAMLVNPHLKYGDGETRGFGRVDLTPKACTVTFRGVANALDRTSGVRDLATFVVEDGRPGVVRA